MRARRGCFSTMRAESLSSHERIRRYLEGPARLVLEVSHDQRLLPVFLRIVALVPATVRHLRRGDQRRLAGVT